MVVIFQMNPFYSTLKRSRRIWGLGENEPPNQLPPTPVVESEGAVSGFGVMLNQWLDLLEKSQGSVEEFKPLVLVEGLSSHRLAMGSRRNQAQWHR